jgi:hypothetical protein
MRAAVVSIADNIVANIVVLNEISEQPPEGMFFVDVDHMACDIGWFYDSVVNDFVNLNPPVEEA